MTARPRAWPWWLGAAAVATAVFALSSLPGPSLRVNLIHGLDKLVHGTVYALLAGLLAGGGVARGWPRRASVLIAVVAAGVYGATDEWHQSFVPYRSASLADLVADVVGAVLGAVASTSPAVQRLVYRRDRHGHRP